MSENDIDEALASPRPDPKRRHGLMIVNTGDGKGKTTASLGLAFRALGSGFKVFMVQYIKGKWKTGEKKLADRIGRTTETKTLLKIGPWAICREVPTPRVPDVEIRPMGDGF